MDPARVAGLQEYLANSNQRMDRQDEQVTATTQAVQALVAQVSELSTQLQQLRQPAAPAPPPVPQNPVNIGGQHEPRIPTPERYAGEPNLCRSFLTRCSLFFSLQPMTFATENSRVALVLNLLAGRAALWGTAVWENRHTCCSSFQALSEEMRRVFDRAIVGREAAQKLTELRQGNRPVSDYIIEFRTLTTECKWNEEAQWDHFLHGLADRVQREIFTLELPTNLNGLMELAVRVDSRLEYRDQRFQTRRLPEYREILANDTVSPPIDHEPMQVGRARLSREERERRKTGGLCLYCGAAGHFLNQCPLKERARQ